MKVKTIVSQETPRTQENDVLALEALIRAANLLKKIDGERILDKVAILCNEVGILDEFLEAEETEPTGYQWRVTHRSAVKPGEVFELSLPDLH